MPADNVVSKDTVQAFAGFSAGVASTLIAHPLDIIKTRLQIDNTRQPLLNSSRVVLQKIIQNEGPNRLAALYRGLTPNLVGNSASWALFFVGYQRTQDLIRAHKGYRPEQALSGAEYFAASMASGLVATVVLNPIWVIKTRMLVTSATQAGAYPNIPSAFRSIYRQEGTRGFFNGLVPTIIGVSHGAVQFVAYEKLKSWRRTKHRSAANQEPQQVTTTDTLIASSLSKVCAAVLTYPHQVVRARMQSHDPSTAMPIKAPRFTQVIQDIWRHEGFIGYYKGLLPNLIRIIPSTCVTFLVYEKVKGAFPEAFVKPESSSAQSNNSVEKRVVL